MAGGDFSGCVEFSASYSNLLRLEHGGRFAVSFDCTGDEQKAIIGKDPTVDLTVSAFYLEYAHLSCSTTSARLFDGSGGGFILGVVGDNSDNLSGSQTWSFPFGGLRCLTGDNTQGICLSSGDGYVSGMIIGQWGNP